jgi:hypothetical protein
MQIAIDQFRQNIQNIKNLHGAYLRISTVLTSVVDLTDILRAEIVMIVSSLDHYVHELARLGMLDVYEGRRQPTAAFMRFDVPLDSVFPVPPSGSDWLESQIRARHGSRTFQQPDKIADAVRMFASVELWNEVARPMGRDPAAVKTQLQLLVDRRNKIAHEADIDPTFPGSRWPINPQMVDEAREFVSDLVESIHVVAA